MGLREGREKGRNCYTVHLVCRYGDLDPPPSLGPKGVCSSSNNSSGGGNGNWGDLASSPASLSRTKCGQIRFVNLVPWKISIVGGRGGWRRGDTHNTLTSPTSHNNNENPSLFPPSVFLSALQSSPSRSSSSSALIPPRMRMESSSSFPTERIGDGNPLGREGEKRNGKIFTKSGMPGRKTSRSLARLTRFIFFLCRYGLRNLSTIIPSLSVSLPSPSVMALCNSNLHPSSSPSVPNSLLSLPPRFSHRWRWRLSYSPPYDRNITRFAKLCAEK